MFEIVKAGGWLMIPIIICSILAIAIIIERFWVLRVDKVAPRDLLPTVWKLLKENRLTTDYMKNMRRETWLGSILAAGLQQSRMGREAMKDSVQQQASHVAHEMERFLNTLGTIALISPLLGLLGTVLGMIEVFTAIMLQGTGNAGVLAGGISQALITTAAGLLVAIPAMIFYRALRRRVDTILIMMEQDCVKLIDALTAETPASGMGGGSAGQSGQRPVSGSAQPQGA
ncbi:MAG: MotA/TolQ/ExbB proton channel family protein [Natronospirillum sp.]|uniref:MotA/TolQ/ExbB proton channel family protein n=1 Tax=Natronospirillum sp. TaxID=2812955 RepID=UPI0025CE0307|nr:MotA/TolQ/ExbB proton channel family protein [Natronospirillum sp.]MCH8553303.1 MotA/TolQ/ExbB proton channel family protein [Natronospirillum sp.]